MRLGWVLISIFFMAYAPAQGQAFLAESDAASVPVGTAFNVTFTLKNAEAGKFNPPDFDGFRVISGPMRSYQSSFVNGKGTTSTRYVYSIQALKEGKLTIGPASILVKGKPLQSKPLSINVTPPKDPATIAEVDPETQIFLRAEIDTALAYVGQQVMLRYRIYTRVNIDNYNILSESPYDACFVQALDAYKEPVITTEINGVSYSSKVLRKVALYPQQSGPIQIDPIVIQIGIQKKNRRSPFGGFFSSMSYDRRNLTSNALELDVRSALDGAPPEFSGAVGTFSVTHQVNRNSGTTDDAIVLVMNITGNGDVKTIRAPKMEAPDGVEVYDPKTTLERMVNATDSVRGEKRFEYLLTFDKPGKFLLTPSFHYFKPGVGFMTDSDTLMLAISPGKKTIPTDDALPETAEDDALAPIATNGRVRRVGRSYLSSAWYWGSFSVPVLAFLLMSWRSRKRDEEPDVQIDHSALARTRLTEAEALLTSGSSQEFYQEVAFSIKKYLGWRLSIDAAEFSRDRIATVLAEVGTEPALIASTLQLIETCDTALYAGVQSEENMRSTYQSAVALIRDFEAILHESLPSQS
ncbi:MAG: BatD family protein [Saprospiraceae bacterium]|nr:BatD family protein [Saprospiraceae bacterium]